MNDDNFEKKLLALTGAAGRPDPTPAWKADILARALREAEAAPLTRLAPPRWLLLSWAAAWIAILTLVCSLWLAIALLGTWADFFLALNLII